MINLCLEFESGLQLDIPGTWGTGSSYRLGDVKISGHQLKGGLCVTLRGLTGKPCEHFKQQSGMLSICILERSL